MKKVVILIILILALLLSSSAQDLFSSEKVAVTEEELAEEIQIIEEEAGTTPDSLLYVVDVIIEDINLQLKSGEEKAEYALTVKEEKLAEAAVMIGSNQSAGAQEALIRASNISGIVAAEAGLSLKDKVTERSQLSEEFLAELKERLPSEEEWNEVKGLLESQLSQEEKIKIASALAGKIGDYCDNLAQQDFEMMIEDDYCNPEKAPEWLKAYIEEDLQDRQDQAEEMMIEMLTTCINDPRECDCSQIPVQNEQRECEENTQLAVRCEFENDLSACEELEQKPIEAPEGMPDFLKPIFESTIKDLIEEKEEEMFAKFAPPECVEAGLDNREDCEKLMMDKYMPPECKEAGATSKEECKEIMMEKYGAPPEECMKDGKPLSREECDAIMIQKYNIPDECIKNGHPIEEEDCIEIMAPPECKEAGAFSKEECEKVMIEKYMPSECKEAGAVSKEECEEVMQKKMAEIGTGGPPPECIENGEFIGMEECSKIMEEKFAGGMPPLEVTFPSYEIIPIREDLVLIRNPETGEFETVTQEQAGQWIEENLGTVLPPAEQGEELQQLRREIEDLQRQKDEPFIPPGEGPSFSPDEQLPPGIEEPSLPNGEAPGEGGPETWQPQEGSSLPSEEESGLPPSENAPEESAPEPSGEESESSTGSSGESSSSEGGSNEGSGSSEGGGSENGGSEGSSSESSSES